MDSRGNRTHQGPPQTDVSPPGMPVRCRWHLRRHRRRGQRIYGTQSCGYGTDSTVRTGTTDATKTRRTSTKLDWYFWSRGATSRWTSPRKRTWHLLVNGYRRAWTRYTTFSSSSYGTYHFESRVLPCRFCRACAVRVNSQFNSVFGHTNLDQDEPDHSAQEKRRRGTASKQLSGRL